MKGTRFSVEQIVAVLKQVELGLPVADAIRHVGISEQMREFKQLSEENARLKKLVAELSLDKAVLLDVLSKKFPGQRS